MKYKGFFVCVCISSILLFLFIFIYIIQFSSFFVINENSEPKIIYIEKGVGLSKLISQLNKINVLNEKLLFKIAGKFVLKINDFTIKYGEYEINNNELFYDFLKKVSYNQVLEHKISFPEGLTTREMIEIINNNHVLNGDNLDFNSYSEGILMPETYLFVRGTTKTALLQIMINDMNDFLTTSWNDRDIHNDDVIKTKKDALILASVVEKESKLLAEKPLIAGLFLNRLRQKIRLQSDPTTIYEITKGKYELNRKLTFKDLLIEGEYNTYKKYGLPVEPIANPGKGTIFATLHPTVNNYLYFVLHNKDTGQHIFTETFEEHLKFANKYRGN